MEEKPVENSENKTENRTVNNTASDNKMKAGKAADLSMAPKGEIEVIIRHTKDKEVFNEIFEANKARDEVVRMLYEHQNTPSEIRERAANALKARAVAKEVIENKKQEVLKKQQQHSQDEQKERLAKKIQSLGVGDRVKLAMRGGGEVRSILINDSNKLVLLAVLENPRISDSEVEKIAKNRAAPEDALRAIAKKKEWMRNYTIVHTLVTNPKTPAGISMKLVPSLKKSDLKFLEKNKNVPEGVRAIARKLMKSGN